MPRQIVAAIADLHCGHQMALMSPETRLWEEDEAGNKIERKLEPTAMQKWLWHCYEKDRCNLLEWADGDPVTLFVNGDLSWGHKYLEGVVTTRTADQIIMVRDVLRPWLPDVKLWRIAEGTDNHEFGELTTPLLVAELLRETKPDIDIRVVKHGLAHIDGVGIDYAHHGPSPGIRQWTTGNQLRYYAKSLMNTEIANGREPPRIILRAHYHTFVWETVRIWGDRLYQTDIILQPAYIGMTGYAQRTTRSAWLISCGMVGIEIVDKHVREIKPFWRKVDLRAEEDL